MVKVYGAWLPGDDEGGGDVGVAPDVATTRSSVILRSKMSHFTPLTWRRNDANMTAERVEDDVGTTLNLRPLASLALSPTKLHPCAHTLWACLGFLEINRFSW